MKSVFLAVAVLVLAAPALAWNCSDPLASRVDVGSTMPSGATAGDGDGQWYKGTDAAHPNDYYVCQVPKPTPPPTPAPPPTASPSQSQQQNQQQNQSSNSSATSNSQSNSTANSSSGSKSSSSATGGNSSSTASGGSATAMGGTSGVKNSGNSTLGNSGNSSNSNSNTANGGTGGTGGSATSSNNSSGNQTNISTNTQVAAPKIPVDTAYAPNVYPTVPCFKGFSGGAQGAAFGATFGGGKIDQNCAELEAARQAPSKLARCKVYISNKYVKNAGVTLEDCMAQEPQPVVVPVPVAQAPPVVIPEVTVHVVQDVPQTGTIVPETSTAQIVSIGGCTVTRLNACNRELDQALIYLERDPRAEISIHGPLQTMGGFVAYVKSHGYSASRVRISLDDVNTIDIGVWSVQ